jgi:threonine dehydrogenase-like Zn-dependent dehydrogenase
VGSDPGGIFGYSHALGGFMGSHAEYVRVPFADHGAFTVPEPVDDVSALFASDGVPTGWMGAHLGGVGAGDTVAVWRRRGRADGGPRGDAARCRAGRRHRPHTRATGHDRHPHRGRDPRLQQHRRRVELRERTGGRGPDVCIEAVGQEAHTYGPEYLYDKVKQQLRPENDRPPAIREAIMACRKGGSVFSLGVFAGLVDKLPLGALMNKGLTLRGAQQHGQRYVPMLLDRIARSEISTAPRDPCHVVGRGPHGYDMFKDKEDGCVRAVFRP